MAPKKVFQRVTAIVPAYNEAERIGGVLDVLTSCEGLDQIIVVDDGSTDGTESVARQYPALCLKLPFNQGKGAALEAASLQATGETLLFVDADLIGLTHSIVDEILRPVLRGEADMFVAMCGRRIYHVKPLMPWIPLLGGQRALKKTLWERLPPYYKHCFRVEMGLNFYARHYGRGLRYKVFHELSHVTKEKKYGWLPGFRQRLRMFLNLLSAQSRLQLFDLTLEMAKRRWALLFAGLIALAIFLVSRILTWP